MSTVLFVLLCTVVSVVLAGGSVIVYANVAVSLTENYMPNPYGLIAIVGIPVSLVAVPNWIATDLFKFESWKDALAVSGDPISTALLVIYFLIYVVIFGYGAMCINKALRGDQELS